MSGRRSKSKGYRREAGFVKMCEAAGLRAHRVPLSGGAGLRSNSSQHDVIVESFEAEVKARANGEGFKVLDDWKGNADFLVLWKDYAKPCVYMDFDLFAEMLLALKESADLKAKLAEVAA